MLKFFQNSVFLALSLLVLSCPLAKALEGNTLQAILNENKSGIITGTFFSTPSDRLPENHLRLFVDLPATFFPVGSIEECYFNFNSDSPPTPSFTVIHMTSSTPSPRLTGLMNLDGDVLDGDDKDNDDDDDDSKDTEDTDLIDDESIIRFSGEYQLAPENQVGAMMFACIVHNVGAAVPKFSASMTISIKALSVKVATASGEIRPYEGFSSRLEASISSLRNTPGALTFKVEGVQGRALGSAFRVKTATSEAGTTGSSAVFEKFFETTPCTVQWNFLTSKKIVKDAAKAMVSIEGSYLDILLNRSLGFESETEPVEAVILCDRLSGRTSPANIPAMLQISNSNYHEFVLFDKDSAAFAATLGFAPFLTALFCLLLSFAGAF